MDSAPQDFGSQILLVIIRQEVKSIENFFYICGHVYITSYLYKNYIRKLLFFVSKEGFLFDYFLIKLTGADPATLLSLQMYSLGLTPISFLGLQPFSVFHLKLNGRCP